jgi:hypothetical protein
MLFSACLFASRLKKLLKTFSRSLAMPEFFAALNLLTLFLIITGAGFIFLLLSLVIGDLFDSFHLNHDFAGTDLGVLDSRVISVFVTAFGGFGAIGVQLGWNALASSLFGLVGGLIFGGVVGVFARFLQSQQASSAISAVQLVGRTAQVTVSIKPNQLGQIVCRIGEEKVEKLARTKNESEIRAGEIVRIEAIAGDSVIVAFDENSKPYSSAITT